MKKYGQAAAKILLLFCVAFTLFFGGFLLKNGPDVLKMAHVLRLIDQHYLWETSDTMLFEGSIGGLVDGLGDKYSTYYDAERTKMLLEDYQGSFGGIGVYVQSVDGAATVVAPIAGSPSEAAGIEAGDVIIQVDGESVAGMNLDDIVLKMKGDVGTSVKIGVIKAADSTFQEYDLTRAIIDEQTVSGLVLDGYPEIGYIQIAKFSQNTDEHFVETLNTLIKAGIQGLIIDLRNNGGGDVDAACNIAQLFVPAGPIVHIVDKDGNTETKTSAGPQFQAPVVLLINGHSASASEILSGAMKDTQSATLVGTQTYGKGLVQGVYFLQDGTSVKLTQSKYLTPNRNDINQVGISPDVKIELTREDTSDVQLEKAIEVLERQMGK